jgi:hypothetical protein
MDLRAGAGRGGLRGAGALLAAGMACGKERRAGPRRGNGLVGQIGRAAQEGRRGWFPFHLFIYSSFPLFLLSILFEFILKHGS